MPRDVRGRRAGHDSQPARRGTAADLANGDRLLGGDLEADPAAVALVTDAAQAALSFQPVHQPVALGAEFFGSLNRELLAAMDGFSDSDLGVAGRFLEP